MRGLAVRVKNNLSFLCHLSGFAMTACIMGKWAISKNYVMAGMFWKNLSYALLGTFKIWRLNSYSAWRQVNTVPIYHHTLHFRRISFISKLGVWHFHVFFLKYDLQLTLLLKKYFPQTHFDCRIIWKGLLMSVLRGHLLEVSVDGSKSANLSAGVEHTTWVGQATEQQQPRFPHDRMV